jgi:hypothetical protein
LELSGATITVHFSDGTNLSGQLFALNEGASFYLVHSEIVLTEAPVVAAPQIGLVGTATPSIVTSAAQTVRVTGPVGAAVRLLQTEVALHLAGVANGGYDIDPYEGNKVVFVRDDTAVIGASGFVDIPVTLRDSRTEGGLNYFIAVIDLPGGVTSAVSNVLKVALNDLPPGSVVSTSLSIAAASANNSEGNSATTPFTFTVTRSGSTSETTTVNYAVTGSGAVPADAADFGGSLPSGVATFTDGQSSQTITVNVSGDLTVESNETFSVTLSGASGGATITTAAAIGTIVNDDNVAGESGLTGEYYNSTNLTGAIATTRVDATVNFPQDWGSAPAGTAVTADDNYSVRWTGYVETSTAGSWTFFTMSNDGVRLWIDDVLVIDNWTTHVVTENSATLTLSAGWHSIRLEYFQQNGAAAITLSFQGPGQVKSIIPQSKLNTANPAGAPQPLSRLLLAGDYDQNNVVDSDDYLVWKSEYGMSGDGLDADGNGDGIVNAADYAVWRSNLGAFLPSIGAGEVSETDQDQPGPAASAALAATVDDSATETNSVTSVSLIHASASAPETDTVTLSAAFELAFSDQGQIPRPAAKKVTNNAASAGSADKWSKARQLLLATWAQRPAILAGQVTLPSHFDDLRSTDSSNRQVCVDAALERWTFRPLAKKTLPPTQSSL